MATKRKGKTLLFTTSTPKDGNGEVKKANEAFKNKVQEHTPELKGKVKKASEALNKLNSFFL